MEFGARKNKHDIHGENISNSQYRFIRFDMVHDCDRPMSESPLHCPYGAMASCGKTGSLFYTPVGSSLLLIISPLVRYSTPRLTHKRRSK